MNPRFNELELFKTRIPKIILQMQAMDEAIAKSYTGIRDRFNPLLPISKGQFVLTMIQCEVFTLLDSKPNDAHFLVKYVNALMVESDKFCGTFNAAAAKKLFVKPENLILDNPLANFVKFMLDEIDEISRMKGLSAITIKGLSDYFHNVIFCYKGIDAALRQYELHLFKLIEGIVNTAKEHEGDLDFLENYLNDRGVSADNTPSPDMDRIVRALLTSKDVASEIAKQHLSVDSMLLPAVMDTPLAPSGKKLTENELLIRVSNQIKELAAGKNVTTNPSTTFKPSHSQKAIDTPAQQARKGKPFFGFK